jgi:hypothetical protein
MTRSRMANPLAISARDARGRFIRACRACERLLAEDESRLCADCWASDLYCEDCGGMLEADTATLEGYERACLCPRADIEDLEP